MVPKPMKLFISHSSQDKTIVNLLIARLKDAGLPEPWYDVLEIDALTSNISKSLETGIREANYFAIVLSPASVDSHWVTYEIDAVLREQKPVMALLHNAPSGIRDFLSNPHVNRLLEGGQRKVINLTDLDDAITEILIAIDPEKGRERAFQRALVSILEDEDPDAAERAITSAMRDEERLMAALIERLPKLRDSRFTRYRATRSFVLIGERTLPTLFDYLLAARPVEGPPIPPPSVLPDQVNDEGISQYVGDSAVDLIRWIVLTGNPVWSAQIGAQYSLVALAESSPSLSRRILEHLYDFLGMATTYIADRRSREEFSDEFYDKFRLAIETIGMIPQPALEDSFLIYQYASSQLWGPQAEEAKYKISSYVITCLGRMASRQSLEYLLTLTSDEFIKDEFFTTRRHPNPLETCFVPFGNQAVAPLLEEFANTSDLQWKRLLLLNLSKIPNPEVGIRILDNLGVFESADAPYDAPKALGNLARSAVPSVADRLVSDFLRDALCPELRDGDWWLGIQEAVAIAAQHVSTPDLADEACNSLLDCLNPAVQVALANTIGNRRLYRFYDVLKDRFGSTNYGAVRARAAIALVHGGVIQDAGPLLAKLPYADEEYEVPELSIALAHLGDTSAVPGLAKGLRRSFLNYEDQMHDGYADALRLIRAPEAEAALKKWYRRI